MLRPLSVWTLALGVAACGEDEAFIRPDTHTPDADTDSDTDSPAQPTPWEQDWPPLRYGELLPKDLSVDESYQGLGDAVVSTLLETKRSPYGFASVLDSDGALKVPADQVGHLIAQPGEPHRLRHQLAFPEALDQQAFALVPGALNEAFASRLYLAALADPQLVDQDSPVSPATNATFSMGSFRLPAYRHAGEFLPHLLDLAVQTLNRFHAASPFDALLLSGDLIENAQSNELHWVHTILKGGEVLADSGARDDIFPGPGNDAFDPFIAEGLAPDLPWVAVTGNHDLNLIGNFPPVLMEAIHALPGGYLQLQTPMTPLGLVVPGYPTSDWHPAFFPPEARSAFRVNPFDFHPLQLAQPEELRALKPASIVADPARQPLSLCDWIEAHHQLDGLPLGHGYDAQAALECRSFFRWDPLGPDVPIRIVGLSLGPTQGGPYGILSRPVKDGALDESKVGDPRFDQIAFLEAELAAAQEDGVALILLAHQPSEDMRTDALLRSLALFLDEAPDIRRLMEHHIPGPIGALSTREFRQLLAKSDHVLAYVAGHTHTNGIVAICPDGSAKKAHEGTCEPGENGQSGYWEMTTSGVLAFPHQLRLLEVLSAKENPELGALYSTMLDLRPSGFDLSWQGLFVALAYAQTQPGHWGYALGDALDRNVLLPVRFAPKVASRLAALPPTHPLRSETTLKMALPALPALPRQP